MPNNNINIQYQYDSEDIENIFLARVAYAGITDDYRLTKALYFSKENKYDIAMKNFIDKLASAHYSGVVLFPCNQSSYQLENSGKWAGICLRFRTGVAVSASYLGVLDGNVIPAEFIRFYNQLNLLIDFTVGSGFTDNTSCNSGPILIQSFIEFMSPEEKQHCDVKKFRDLDIEALKKSNKVKLETFIKKQSLTPEVSSASKLVQVSQEVSDLISSIKVVSANLKVILGVSTEAISYADMDEQIRAVSDIKGNISLQLKYVADNKNLARFLYRPAFSKDSLESIRNNSYVLSAGATGLIGSVASGSGLTAAYAAFQEGYAISAFAGVRGASLIFNPIAGSLTVGAMAALYIAEQQSTTFADNIKKAVNLYDIADNGERKILADAENIMLNELGLGEEGNYFNRVARWISTPWQQYLFADLVLAQIMARQGNMKALGKFSQVYESSQSGDNLKAMSLMGQLSMLSNDNIWTNNVDNYHLSITHRDVLINVLSAELNNKFPKIVQQHLNMSMQAYADVENIVMTQGKKHSSVEFDSIIAKLNTIINFKNISCFRYFKPERHHVPAGKIAEVVFIFAQHLSHKVIENYYKINNNDLFNVEREKAEDLLILCLELINTFGLRELKCTEVANIIDVIDRKSLDDKKEYHNGCSIKHHKTSNVPEIVFNVFKHWKVEEGIVSVANNTSVTQEKPYSYFKNKAF